MLVTCFNAEINRWCNKRIDMILIFMTQQRYHTSFIYHKSLINSKLCASKDSGKILSIELHSIFNGKAENIEFLFYESRYYKLLTAL